MNLNGIVPVFKPIGWTSTDVVRKIKKNLIIRTGDKKVKIGHGGTLDPFASGILVIGVGKGCTNLPRYIHGNKRYLVQGRLGITTDTQDLVGKTISERNYQHITRESIESVLHKFRGEIEQIPPSFSALRVNGVRAYDAARQGVMLELKPRKIHIFSNQLINFQSPFFHLDLTVSSGTYIRTIVHDIGEMLGTGAHASELSRTEVGSIKLEDCLSQRQWEDAETFIQSLKKSRENESERLHQKEKQKISKYFPKT
eukprot:TRINITY_DN2946_c0_g1_i3.p1 TRINITY_DN2946_c0_g1~~TRINITY_DN2946_c0_g1_i3.p1  ORF type:complete len:255 (+),score=29.69 TRINITY_DN2946_c0_g1_i3:226-990(+)